MKPIKIVFDTNAYLAALKRDSYASIHLKRSQPNGPYLLFISPEIIIEIRAKLEDKFGYSVSESADFVEMVLKYAVLVQPRRRLKAVLRDKDDHKILECALQAEADIIITADRGMLRLKEFENIKIVHPSMLKYWFPAGNSK